MIGFEAKFVLDAKFAFEGLTWMLFLPNSLKIGTSLNGLYKATNAIHEVK